MFDITKWNKIEFVISEKQFCHITKSNLWYYKIIMTLDIRYPFLWYLKIDFVISQICIFFCKLTDQANFVILQINILFAISHIKLKFCDITISILK